MSVEVDPGHMPAILAIHHLKARYFRCVDSKSWEMLATLFTSDATLFFPENQSEPIAVHLGIPFIAEALAGAVSIHHGHMPEIEILSADQAVGIWAMEDRIFWPPDKPTVMGLESLHGYGHYHEQYRRVDGRWLIQSLKVTRLWTRGIPPARGVS